MVPLEVKNLNHVEIFYSEIRNGNVNAMNAMQCERTLRLPYIERLLEEIRQFSIFNNTPPTS